MPTIIPFIKHNSIIEYLILKRNDVSLWQFVSGGGENNETPIEAAKRELIEETGITAVNLIPLKTNNSIPIRFFKEHRNKKNLYVIPEFCFAIKLDTNKVIISHEHSEYQFSSYSEAYKILKYDSNKTALWELRERIINDDL